MENGAKKILQDVFGFSDFRVGQKDVINTILSRTNTHNYANWCWKIIMLSNSCTFIQTPNYSCITTSGTNG